LKSVGVKSRSVKLPIATGGYFGDQVCMLGLQNTLFGWSAGPQITQGSI